jgi:small multidrug resistance family-3 protein
MNSIASSITLFVLAGLAEIGGGYLMWLWWRDGRTWPLGLVGGVALVLYGIIPTYQPAHFGRVYAAYGGIFVILSVIWGWMIDGIVPDRFDWVGAVLCLLGVGIMMYAPRST